MTMTRRALVAVLFAIVLACLTPFAYATPVDPTWVPGFWDNGDFDDVVLFICGMAGDLPVSTTLYATRDVVTSIETSSPTKPPRHAATTARTRAPPLI
jgi:hypothetical protein